MKYELIDFRYVVLILILITINFVLLGITIHDERGVDYYEEGLSDGYKNFNETQYGECLGYLEMSREGRGSILSDEEYDYCLGYVHGYTQKRMEQAS